MRMTIKTKLGGAFALVIAMSMGAGGLAYQKLSDMTETQAVLVNWTKRLDVLGDMSAKLQTSIRSEKNAILAPDQKLTEEFAGAAVLNRAAAIKIRNELFQIASEGGKRRLAEIGTTLDKFSSIQDETLKNARLNSSFRASQIWDTESRGTRADVNAAFEASLTGLASLSAAETHNAVQAVDTARLAILGAMIAVSDAMTASTMPELDAKLKGISERITEIRDTNTKALKLTADLGVASPAVATQADRMINLVTRVSDILREGGNIKAAVATMG